MANDTEEYAADGVIEAADFRPTGAVRERRRLLPRRVQVVATVVVLVVAWFLWFIFTARSVRFEAEPADAEVTVSGGFAFQLGDTFLLRQGEYEVAGTASGYHDLSETKVIGAARNQVLPLTLTPLPGRITFEIDPVDADVQVDDTRGAAPLTVDLPAGEHTALVSHPRYQAASVDFFVEGMRREQTVSASLAPNWADITIPTTPPGAQIRIDDEPSGVTTPGPVQILAGEHRVTVKLAGHKAWNDILSVTAGEAVTLPAVTLERADGLLSVITSPAGAGVTVNGDYRGETPLEVAVQPGRHDIRVFRLGYTPWNGEATVQSGREGVLELTLEAASGEIAIETRPDGVELWVDGEYRGEAAGVVTLSAVEHEIELRKEGHAGYSRTILPQPGYRQQIRVRLLTLAEARLANLKPERVTSLGQELVLLGPGSITMGASRREPGRRANEVLREVEITRLFYLSRREVSNAEFRAFASAHSSGKFNELDLDEDEQPVTAVSWTEAALYCNWLSRREGLDPFYIEEFGDVKGYDPASVGYRLPTEAEWAWSARSTEAAPLRFPWGDQLPPPDRHGNYADRAASNVVGRIIFGYNDNYIVAAPVGSFPANPKGIYDLGGNVAEWTHDFYDIPEGTEAVDPLGAAEGDYHVIRGSSWMHGTITDLRLSFRDYGSDGRQDVGFRIARFAE